MADTEHRNRLADETSPYLLQHAGNPVDWHPWDDEALAKAREEDRPILLSIGYAACHWCHVMERESFEDPSTAGVMNEHFVCIKVDREERPDIDDIYMRAVQMMTGRGGWPLTVFLTPELEPFYGGTYFPPESRMGMPSFRSVLEGVTSAWEQRRDEVDGVAGQLREQLQPRTGEVSGELADTGLLQKAATALHERFDPNHGGFGGAPKFPNATSVSLLLRHSWRRSDPDSLSEAVFSLDQMAAGGIHDQLAGGFHRYAVDTEWLVPHFEKMLYDNALLAEVYLEAFQLTGETRHARVVGSTLDWALEEMLTPEGGFASSLDADSEGVEGKFYVWDKEEIDGILGEDAGPFCTAYGVTRSGNWEGTNILHLPRPLELVANDEGIDEAELREHLARGRERLLQARAERVRPGTDDKVLADWNGLLIVALARAARVLGEARYGEAAVEAATFVLERMRPEGRLHHAFREGRVRVPAFLDDYAAMLRACTELFLTTFDPRWIEHARELADDMVELFAGEGEGLYFTATGQENLLARPLSAHDGATPSGNGMAVRGLSTLAHITADDGYAARARQIPTAFHAQLRQHPSGHATLLLGLDELWAEPRETVVVGESASGERADALARLWRRYLPEEIVLAIDPEDQARERLEGSVPVLTGKAEAAGEATPVFFPCRNRTCEAPTTDLEEVLG